MIGPEGCQQQQEQQQQQQQQQWLGQELLEIPAAALPFYRPSESHKKKKKIVENLFFLCLGNGFSVLKAK